MRVPAIFVGHRRGDDQEDEVVEAGIGERVRHAGGQEDHVVAAHHPALVADLHQPLALQHVIDLLLNPVRVPLDMGPGRVAGDPVVNLARAGGSGMDQQLRQRAAVMAGQLVPRQLGYIADEGLALHAVLPWSACVIRPRPGAGWHRRRPCLSKPCRIA
jgi:hypothetical protein